MGVSTGDDDGPVGSEVGDKADGKIDDVVIKECGRSGRSATDDKVIGWLFGPQNEMPAMKGCRAATSHKAGL